MFTAAGSINKWDFFRKIIEDDSKKKIKYDFKNRTNQPKSHYFEL